jgi:hypothetical protein
MLRESPDQPRLIESASCFAPGRTKLLLKLQRPNKGKRSVLSLPGRAAITPLRGQSKPQE